MDVRADADVQSPESALAGLMLRPVPRVDFDGLVGTSASFTSVNSGEGDYDFMPPESGMLPRGLGKDSDDLRHFENTKKSRAFRSDSAFLPDILSRSPLADAARSVPSRTACLSIAMVKAVRESMRQPAVPPDDSAGDAAANASVRSREVLLRMQEVGPKGTMEPIWKSSVKKQNQGAGTLSLGKSDENGGEDEEATADTAAENELELDDVARAALDEELQIKRAQEEQAAEESRFDSISVHELATSTAVLSELPCFVALRKCPAERSPADRLLLGPILQSCPPLKGISNSSLARLCATVQVRDFRNGDFLFREGDAADGFYIVLAGVAHVLTDSGSIGLRPVNTLTPGQGFGELALLNRSQRSASVQVINKSGLMVAFWDRGTYRECFEALHRTENKYYSAYLF
jgi:hypothetical protein